MSLKNIFLATAAVATLCATSCQQSGRTKKKSPATSNDTAHYFDSLKKIGSNAMRSEDIVDDELIQSAESVQADSTDSEEDEMVQKRYTEININKIYSEHLEDSLLLVEGTVVDDESFDEGDDFPQFTPGQHILIKVMFNQNKPENANAQIECATILPSSDGKLLIEQEQNSGHMIQFILHTGKTPAKHLQKIANMAKVEISNDFTPKNCNMELVMN